MVRLVLQDPQERREREVNPEPPGPRDPRDRQVDGVCKVLLERQVYQDRLVV